MSLLLSLQFGGEFIFFLQSPLQNKYFDSGDYNMAKAKVSTQQKAPNPLMEPKTGDHMPTPEELPRIRKGSQSNLVSLPRHLQR